MLESLFSGFANISLLELVLIAGMALVASVVGESQAMAPEL